MITNVVNWRFTSYHRVVEIRVYLPRRGFVGLCGLLLGPSLKFTHIRFCFILKYLLFHQWRKVSNFLHYYVWHKLSSKWHTDTVFVQIPTFVFCLFVCFFDFGQFIYNFETGKLPAHERNNFIFHVNMHFCNIVLFHKCRYWVLATQCIILYKNCAIFSSNEQTC